MCGRTRAGEESRWNWIWHRFRRSPFPETLSEDRKQSAENSVAVDVVTLGMTSPRRGRSRRDARGDAPPEPIPWLSNLPPEPTPEPAMWFFGRGWPPSQTKTSLSPSLLTEKSQKRTGHLSDFSQTPIRLKLEESLPHSMRSSNLFL